MAVSKAILERVNSLIFGKKKIILSGLFWLFFSIFFFSIHTLGSRIIFLCSHIFRKRYGFFFFQKGDYLFFVYFVMFSKGIIIRLFLKYNNQKIMEREEERSKWKNEVWNCVEKSVLWAWNWFIPSKNLWFWVSAPWSSDFIIKTF